MKRLANGGDIIAKTAYLTSIEFNGVKIIQLVGNSDRLP